MKVIPPAQEAVNVNYFTQFEISQRLKKCENTAPGPDGITYSHLKKLDPTAIVLTPLCNLCIKFKAVPVAWKKTTTICIYKKGDKKDPGN